jgi:thiol-disulfide isomerase/thioredoxin
MRTVGNQRYAHAALGVAFLVALVAACSAKDKGGAPPSRGSVSAEGEGEAKPFVETARTALVGHRAPPVVLELLDGSRVDLSQLLGKRPIYLKFWATWCEPCREQMPHLEATFREHGDRLAIFAVDVAVDDPIENVREMVAAKKLKAPVAIDRDGSVAEHFYLNVTPQHVLIDKAGIVRFVGHAVTPELESAIAQLVDPARGATAPAVAGTHGPVLEAREGSTTAMPALVLDNGSTLALASRPRAPLALTFAALFCDSYIAKSRPEIGAACAAHARRVEELRRAHPDVTWVIVAYPVWTNADDIGAYRKRLGVAVPVGIDRGNAWFRHFGVRTGYTTILLDASGAELGRVDGDGSDLSALIAKAR